MNSLTLTLPLFAFLAVLTNGISPHGTPSSDTVDWGSTVIIAKVLARKALAAPAHSEAKKSAQARACERVARSIR